MLTSSLLSIRVRPDYVIRDSWQFKTRNFLFI